MLVCHVNVISKHQSMNSMKWHVTTVTTNNKLQACYLVTGHLVPLHESKSWHQSAIDQWIRNAFIEPTLYTLHCRHCIRLGNCGNRYHTVKTLVPVSDAGRSCGSILAYHGCEWSSCDFQYVLREFVRLMPHDQLFGKRINCLID